MSTFFDKSLRVLACTATGTLLFASTALAGGMPVLPPPAGARVVNFDDVVDAPIAFGATPALRGRYAPEGIVFFGPSSDGGAILGLDSGLGTTGFSPPNYLAFDTSASLQGGGLARFPEIFFFRKPVRYVQFNVADPVGHPMAAEALDADNNSVAYQSFNTTPGMQTVVLEGRHIDAVLITTNGTQVVIDDIAFILDTTVIDFDDVAAPDTFALTTALRDEYDDRGVEFLTVGANNGGAILNEAAGFNVTGHSPPNFVGFNTTSTFSDGGHPVFPQHMQFFPPVTHVEFLVGSKDGATINAEAQTWNGETVDTASIVATSAMQPLVLDGPAITSVVVTSSGDEAVIDDLEFLVEGTLIDFDDDTNPPTIFNEAVALRDRYASFGVHFKAPANDGATVLAANAGMNIEGQSGANVLAADSGDQLATGGIPQLPITIEFDTPLKRVELRAADPGESRIFFEGRDAGGRVTVNSDLFAAAKFEHVPLHFEGTTSLVITSDGFRAFFDDLAFLEMDPCEHDPCYQGTKLVNHCSACVTLICDEDSDCCGDSWTRNCAESTDAVCNTTCAPLCGDSNVDRKVSAPDALTALKHAVGDGTPCPKVRCDFNGDDSVLAGDALLILRTGVGQPTVPNCPAPI
jgi:hypothetical protein